MDSEDWEESGDEQDKAGPSQDLQAEWEARKAQHWNSGYREGLDVGKQRTLQQGFDAGYAQGLATGYRFGAAQGAVKALQILDSRHPGLLPGSQQVLENGGSSLLQASDRDAQTLLCSHFLQDGDVGEAEGREGPYKVPDGRAVELLRSQNGALHALAEIGMKMPLLEEHATSNGRLH